MYKARDVMTSNVVPIPSSATIEEAGQILVQNRMSGAPVLDENNDLVGIISEFQLLELVYNPQLKHSPVREFMTSDVVTVDADAPLDTVANMFILHRIRRVPVVSNSQVAGIITRGDILRWLLRNQESPRPQVASR